MVTVNSLSGGKTSSYMAIHYPADYEVFSLVCIDDYKCKPRDKSIIHYVNQKLEKYTPEFGEFIATAEDDKTLYVMRDLEQLLGREIIWVRGVSFDNCIDYGQKLLPAWSRRYCTIKLKILPIFLFWFHQIGQKCSMRIGFRADEFDRMERFFNHSDPCNFRIPVSCKTYGKKLQVHETFNWRFCSFPIIRDGITKLVIDRYWKKNGTIGGNLFEQYRKIDFPAISNCIGCFHKKQETLAAMAVLHPEKMNWFAKQELKGIGTWLDSRVTYQEIINNVSSI